VEAAQTATFALSQGMMIKAFHRRRTTQIYDFQILGRSESFISRFPALFYQILKSAPL
jgi:hypothetical protein